MVQSSGSLRCALPLACLSRLGELEGAPSTESDAKLRRILCASKFVTKKLFLRLHVTNSTQDDWCLPQALVSLRGSDTCLYERVEQAFMKDTP